MDSVLAKKLIEQISKFTDYNVNIMDENGVLIASRMAERVGSFHEVAFDIMKGDQDIVIVEVDIPESGVKAGVNLAVYRNKNKVGVVGVTGNPEQVLPIAKIIKMSVEVMMEYEMFKYESMKKYNLKEQLMHLILYNGNFEREDLESYFNALNLEVNALRVPVLLQLESGTEHINKLKELLDNNTGDARQSLRECTREGFLFLFITLPRGMKNVMQEYKYEVGDFLSPLLRYARDHHLWYSVFVGPVVNDIMYYRRAYLNCAWMQKTLGDEEKRSYYFYDHIVHFLESMLSWQEFNTMFQALKNELGKKFIDNYTEVMSALIDKGYNLNSASAMLHVHKNTLIYRLDKIRETLNMNPLNFNSDREFMECFYYYLCRK